MSSVVSPVVDSAELHSPQWYRVANLKLKMRAGVLVSRQVARDQVWHVLTDPNTGRQHRFNEPAYRLLEAMDGQRTLDAIWSQLLAKYGDEAPTQPEVLRVVAHAYSAQLLTGPLAPDAKALVKAQREALDRRRKASVNPLSFRLPLWNPEAFLTRTLPAVTPLLSKGSRSVAWLIAAMGLLMMMWHSGDLARDAQAHAGSMKLLVAMWLVWPLMKALHELAHAYTIKALGGEVHEIGVTLMMLTPFPYVDATSSSAFSDKRDRVAVAAAGILVEALLATVALMGWLVLEPGLARDVCLAVVLVGGLSTLLVNGNALMRYDGYHVLSDALELPNLAPRSLRWWNLLLQRTLLRQRHARMHDLAQGERVWLIAYAPASWVWRVVLLCSLALALSYWSQLLTLGLLALAAWTALLGPVWKAVRWAWQSPEAAGYRLRSAACLGGVAVAGLAALVAVPVADRSFAPGIVWLPDEAFVRLHSDARVVRFLVEDGAQVQPGTPIAELANEELAVSLAAAQQQWRSAQIEHLLRFESDAARTAVAEDQLRRLRAELDDLEGRVNHLTLRSAVSGRVVIQEPHRQLGRWLNQGDLLAQVLPPGGARVRALVSNDDVARVREQPGAIAVQLAYRADQPLSASIERAVPQASRSLPSAAMGERAGGPLPIDASDTTGRTAAQARFAFDLRLPEGADARVGARAMVSFEHGHAVAADVLLRKGREALLRHLPK
jgi:putative peptide zinc metalloprotease protein